jgi:RNA polymerase sigma-70 factor (ECF subfamily)
MSTATSDEADRSDMEKLAAGHERALNDLMARHGERLYHYLIRLLQDEAEAADLAQETFARVFQNRKRFKPRSKFTAWCYTIATNLARDRLRRLARHPEVSLDAETNSAGGNLQTVLPAREPSPRESLEVAERAAAVREAVASLPEDLRVPLVLAEYEQQSYAEIAAVLDCSAKAVEMRLYRARQQLREKLGPMLKPID